MKLETAIDYLDSMAKMSKLQLQLTHQKAETPMIEAIECLVEHTKRYRTLELKNALQQKTKTAL